MSLNELAGFVANPGVGNRPTYFYETWLHKRLAIPVASNRRALWWMVRPGRRFPWPGL